MGVEFWSGLMDWIRTELLSRNTVSEEDLELLHLTDDVEEGVRLAKDFVKERDGSSPP